MKTWQHYQRLALEAQATADAMREGDKAAARWDQVAAAYGELQDLERQSPDLYAALVAKDP
jgi:hypothetical protein